MHPGTARRREIAEAKMHFDLFVDEDSPLDPEDARKIEAAAKSAVSQMLKRARPSKKTLERCVRWAAIDFALSERLSPELAAAEIRRDDMAAEILLRIRYGE